MPDMQREYILIVDDVEKNVQLLAEILISRGFNISPANSGEETLEALENGPLPDLILLDIMMPGISGIEVCRKIKENPATKDIPVIFLTAKTDTESIVEGLSAGASDYVNKPFNADELIARVGVQLENARLRKEILSINKSLAQNISARDQLLSIIAHDLKGPLGSLLGLSQIYARQGTSAEQKNLVEFVDVTFRSLGNILNLLSNLLSWARLQGGFMNVNPEKVDILQSIKKTVDFLRSTADQKNIKINILNDASVNVVADFNMLETILRNLISNAIKFTYRNGEINILYQVINGELELSIKDTGMGMPDHILNNLFKIDVRHQTQGTNKESGTGFGLILCKEMLERNNGKIRVESIPEKGSTFYITLKTDA